MTSELLNDERFPRIKYVVAHTIAEAMTQGAGFPGAANVAKIEVLSDNILVIE